MGKEAIINVGLGDLFEDVILEEVPKEFALRPSLNGIRQSRVPWIEFKIRDFPWADTRRGHQRLPSYRQGSGERQQFAKWGTSRQ